MEKKIREIWDDLINKESFKGSFGFSDLNGKVIICNNNPFKSASIIKIFIMIEAYKKIKQKEINGQEKLILKKEHKVGGAGSLSLEKEGIEIEKAIYLMMTESDNAATNMLIDKLGFNNINLTIKELGCYNTSLNRKMMDFEKKKRGIDNYTTVKDLINIFTKLYNNNCLGKELDLKMINIMKNNNNRGKIPKDIQDNIEISHKTGELEGIENDAGIIYTDNFNYIICALTEDGESDREIKLINKLSKNIFYLLEKIKS